MGSAIGTSSSVLASRRQRGSNTYDIRDFGARPYVAGGPTYADTNRVAIQAAYDAAVAGSVFEIGGDVYVPGGVWYVDGPIMMDSPGGKSVGIFGDGVGRSFITTGANDLLVVGVPRRPLGAVPTPDHFVDLFTGGPFGTPLLDASAVGSAGQRWGLRTKADAHFTQQGGPMDLGSGDGYRSTRRLTIDLAVDLTNAAVTAPPGHLSPIYPGQASLLGMSDLALISPWTLRVQDGAFHFQFRTTTAGGPSVPGEGTERRFSFAIPQKGGLARITVQVDLIGAHVSAFVNGVQVATNDALGADFVAASDLYFAGNEHCPFGLGSNAKLANQVVDWVGGPADFTFCGLKVRPSLVYVNGSVGQTQARVDGQSINDNNRYFSFDAGDILWHLPLTDSPSAIAESRRFAVQGPDNVNTPGYVWDNALTDYAIPGEIRGLTLKCGPNYGRGIAVGLVYTLRVVDCAITAGHQGIGSINTGSTYPVTIQNCTIKANDAAVYLYFASVVMIRDSSLGSNRCHVRLYQSIAKIENTSFLGSTRPDYLIQGLESSYSVVDSNYDGEDPLGGPQIAAFYASGGADYPLGSLVRISNVAVGRLAPGAAVVFLDGPNPDDGGRNRSCVFSLEDLLLFDSYFGPVVRNNGPRWVGEVCADVEVHRPHWVENTADNGKVISLHRDFTGPPRDGTWSTNGHILDVIRPSAGQFCRWRCTSGGAYGTASPPRWQGFEPIDDGMSLAAYVSDHAYFAASGSPAGSLGFWADGPASLFLNGLFGAPMPPPPSGVFAALGTRPTGRAGGFTEIVPWEGPGYGRAQAGTWTISGGTATNAQAIAFPAATGPWKDSFGYSGLAGTDTVTVMGFFDAANGGHYLGCVDIAPRKVVAGAGPSFAAGSITVGPSARSAQGSFALAVHDLMNRYWLNGRTFAAPTVYLALSTAPASLAAPAEPSGGGYARVATAAADWAKIPGSTLDDIRGAAGSVAVITNASTLAFPAPTGNWGTVKSVCLMDAAAGGNVLASANLTSTRTIAGGEPARTFAPGALWLCRS